MVLFAPAVLFVPALALVILLGILEYNDLTSLKISGGWSNYAAAFFGALLPVLFFSFGTASAPPLIAASVFLFFLPGVFRSVDLKAAFLDAALRTFSLCYIALPLAYFVVLRGAQNGRWWVMFLFAVIWANDTAAYATGKTVGAHKLCPEISPNKTVEGAAGGIIGGIITALLFYRFAPIGAAAVNVVVISVILGAVGIFGDLFESVIKRGAGVKDSGSLIPGHGGLLDRIDSLIFAAPVLYYSLIWLS